MSSKDTYLNIIRRSVIINSFIEQYFIKIVVVYLLSQGVTSWVAVSIPVVLEFAKIISRAFKALMHKALKINYRKYHLFYIFILVILCLIISQCRNVYTIYLFTIIMGVFSGLNNSCITKMNTANPEYESYCFIEEERSFTIGATLGLVVSQVLYDFNSKIYLIGFVVVGIIGIVVNYKMPDINDDIDIMDSIEDTKELTKKEKNDTILVTTLFAIMAGFWCMGLSALSELVPLITDKVGYLNALYTLVEVIALFIINGQVMEKIKKNNKLLFAEMIIALFDVSFLLIAAFYQNLTSLVIIFFLTGITSTLGDPIWGSIVSSYSNNSRRNYVLVNNVYFVIRAFFTALTWLVCRQCVLFGNFSFFWLSIILIISIVITFIFANKCNKRVFEKEI